VLKGIAFKVASTLLFACMLALVKVYSAYPVAELVFFRSFFALFILVFWLLMRGDFPRALKTNWFLGHLVRSFAGVGSMFLMFAAYGLLPLADATAIGYAGPLLVVVFAALLLGEKVRATRWSAVMLGFSGVIVMLWEHLGIGGSGGAHSALGALSAFTAAVLVSIAMIQTRRLTRSEDTGAIVFYFQSTTTIVGFLMVMAGEVWPSAWPGAALVQSQAWIWPAAADWAPLIAIGLLGGAGQILMTQSYRFADASIVACFDYSSMIWALILGLVLFGEGPTPIAMVGASIIAAGGLLAIFTERSVRWK
jgi:drug/metabolite transporter (DMT)-like permease